MIGAWTVDYLPSGRISSDRRIERIEVRCGHCSRPLARAVFRNSNNASSGPRWNPRSIAVNAPLELLFREPPLARALWSTSATLRWVDFPSLCSAFARSRLQGVNKSEWPKNQDLSFLCTFLPFLRAFERPIAIACFRLFTLPPLPPRPLLAVPFL
jgi:hypothetical protein